MKLRSQLARIPPAVVLGLLELNCDWLRIATSPKSFLGSGSQTLFSAKTSDRQKYVCVRRLRNDRKVMLLFHEVNIMLSEICRIHFHIRSNAGIMAGNRDLVNQSES